MKEEAVKIRKIMVLLVILLILISLYLFITSLERVPAGEVKVVMEIGLAGTEITLEPHPLVNSGSRAKWFFKQPKIPFLGIGYLKERFKLDTVMDFSTSFAFYTLNEVTGRREDKEIVSAITINGKIVEITDWELFISRLDPDKYNTDDNPYGIKYRDRSEILAEQIKYLVRSGNPESLYPGLSPDEAQPMTPGLKIDYWYKELVSRRNFIVALQDRFGFKREEEFVSFLVNDNPWYWGFGIQKYENLLNQAKDLSEYLQSSLSEGLTVSGYAGKYVNDEDYLLLINMIRRVDGWEKDMLNTEYRIQDLQKQWDEQQAQIKIRTDDPAYLLYAGYLNNLKERDRQLVDVPIEELNGDFIQYINNEVYERLLTAVRKRKLELTMESLYEYESNVINNLNLDTEQMNDVERAVKYLKNKYADYLESDDWEFFTSTFTREVNSFFIENTEVKLPAEDVFQMVYFKLLDYYLRQLSERYEEYKIDSSKLLKSLYNLLLENPALLNGSRTDMAEMITAYLMADESLLLSKAGMLISLNWELNHQREQQKRLNDYKDSVLVPYFTCYIADEDLVESEALWTASIRDVLGGEDLSDYRAYYSHEVEESDNLDTLAKKYGVDGIDFIKHAYSLISFALPEDQKLYNYLNSFRSFDEVYQQVKMLPLKSGSLITFDTAPPYTPSWWESRSIEQNQRELIIKSFAYPWIDAHLPAAFEEFADSSYYIDYLEKFFGLRLADLNLRIENRSVFSNSKIRQVDPDFINIYDAD